jgi:hypothetical protein
MRLKTNIFIAVIAWFLLTWEYPVEGEIPKWWTLVYAVAKYAVAVNVAYIFVHETFPYVRIEKFLEEYKSPGGDLLSQSIVYGSSLIFRAILMAVSIYVLCLW